MQWYSWMHILPVHRVLFTIASHFLNFPPKTLHALVVLNANPSLSKSSCHDCKSFLKLPPPKPYMQWYSWMHILPFHRVLFTIASHFLNFPPPKPYMQWYSSMQIPPFDRVLFTIASHFLNFPPQSPTCNGIPQCESLPLIEFLSWLQVIFKTPPPSPTCNGIPECTPFPFIEFLSRLLIIF